SDMEDYLLKMRAITKSFTGVQALRGVDFKVRKGEVHGLMGENGAGKSTLIKVLTGIHTKDSGDIHFDGEDIDPKTAIHAQELGISTIYQELNLIPYLSIKENIFLGREQRKRGFIDWKQTEIEAQKLMTYLGLDIDVNLILNTQSTAIQQMVSIARALAINTKLLVMDEPTSSLDKKEVQILFEVMEKLKQEQISIIFISHRFEEVYRICDRLTILKDGELEGEYAIEELPEIELVSKMVGRPVQELEKRKKGSKKRRHEESLVSLEKAKNHKLKDVTLDIHKGEVLGLAGLLGSGRTEVGRALFGADLLEAGHVSIDGKGIRVTSIRQTIKEGFSLVPEDRRTEGIIPNMSVRENITLVLLPKLSRMGIISRKKQEQIVDEFIKSLKIKTPSVDQHVKYLSGGNQQKVILARWLCTKPRLIVLDEPTRGIDVGAKAEIEKIIRELADEGISSLFISSELPELIRNSDRIAVMKDGKVVKVLRDAKMSQENIMAA